MKLAFIVIASSLMLASCLRSLAQEQDHQPSFRSVFSSEMVLPHGQQLTLSGYATPDVSLTLEVDGVAYSLNSDASGQWQQQIPPLPAGGPYSIALRDASGAGTVLENVLAGEIWLCSGQSNMAYSVAASIDQPEEYNLGHPAIRLFSVPLLAELSVLDEFKEVTLWENATDANVQRFSALCYFFARNRIEQNGIPLGLINASWGGAAIEAWVSEQGLATVPGFERKVSQLQQFREDQRGAELSFAEDWVQWWQANSDQGDVWESGVLDDSVQWFNAPLQNWKTYADERLVNHHGILWFSTRFELSAEQQQKPATFILGKIDEVDTTWINGKFVNNTFGYGTRREYPLEAGVLATGTNQITVNVTNTWDAGGMMGPVEEVGLLFEDGEFVPLGSDWKYRFILKSTGYPPRSPWESVAGIAGMFNGMIAPLKPLTPTGVIWYQGESNADASASYHGLLNGLVSDWRQYFENQELPIVVVQLPNYGPVATAPVESGWATLRHVQQQVALADDQVGLVVTHDVGDDADIHPKQKWIVGVRAAEVVAALEGSGVANGVVASIVETDLNSVVLDFSPPLVISDNEQSVAGFSLCEQAGRACVYTSASQNGSRIAVNLGTLKNARILRYCWSDGGQCELEAMNGLPLSSFQLSLD